MQARSRTLNLDTMAGARELVALGCGRRRCREDERLKIRPSLARYSGVRSKHHGER